MSILAIKVIHLARGWSAPPAGPIKSCGDVGSAELHRQNLLPGTSINILTQRAIFHPGVRPRPADQTRRSGLSAPFPVRLQHNTASATAPLCSPNRRACAIQRSVQENKFFSVFLAIRLEAASPGGPSVTQRRDHQPRCSWCRGGEEAKGGSSSVSSLFHLPLHFHFSQTLPTSATPHSGRFLRTATF